MSLPDEDVAFLDEYARAAGVGSRSAAVQKAVDLLRTAGLAAAYEEAWSEWDASEDGALWEATAGDGLS